MNRDPFGMRAALIEMSVGLLVVAFCLHWAALLIAEVWPWLLGIFVTMAIGGLAWRVWWFRQGRW